MDRAGDCSPFPLRGYESSLEWSDLAAGGPDLADPLWQRSEKLPEAGESRLVRVSFPFCQSSEETFWSLYEPALSAVNGWSDYPEEIDASAFIECRLTHIVASTPHEAWAIIYISRVIMLRDVCALFPTDTSNPEFINCLAAHARRVVTHHGNWLLFEESSEGDFGQWALVNTMGGDYRLVMFAVWGLHESTAYLGNLLQSRGCVENLITIFKPDENA